ncbi:MAG: hypothetical protein GW762_05210 [Candidatus Pacebacteria bacterium]|nr:hypothetical protein [Candidatus Paceibacterota bacterium]PIR63855.1 MAG: hypothetical protein COU64_02695 [Candidatus Pacebacteria bacterium CG10_big_fil_rev_8_21_14_0_10_40_26]PIZ78369.1 MAG: hypothetical protein COY01_06335 [Candidatus Pacebacteria bacterium CG_4_10_14_0_2_um_filter_40_20]PJA68587.1 MAG: hypothetical protein CO156_03710 [Candidatus Pacebacteria bacterium CG_4_9_14_3_um_filter_40_12]PJC41527.1 MAG: hypothetical protein CO041_02300 [Candidatus Pacebacteria bacterium CG_4_9_
MGEFTSQAEAFNPKTENTTARAELSLDEEMADALSLFDSAKNLTELMGLFNTLSVKKAFYDLTLSHRSILSRLNTTIGNMQRGDTINHDATAAMFPQFMQPLVKSCIHGEAVLIAEQNVEAERNKQKLELNFQQLVNIVTGQNTDESALITAIGLLKNMGDYRGPNNGVAYSMPRLATVVEEQMRIALTNEMRGDANTVENVRRNLLNEIPELRDPKLGDKASLLFFSSAISTYGRLRANGRT